MQGSRSERARELVLALELGASTYRGHARRIENPQMDFFGLGAYGGCADAQTTRVAQ